MAIQPQQQGGVGQDQSRTSCQADPEDGGENGSGLDIHGEVQQ